MNIVEKNTILADFMGLNYKCDSVSLDYHYKQKFNEDGSPYRASGRANVNVDVYDMWHPHRNWNDIIPIAKKVCKLVPTAGGVQEGLRWALMSFEISDVYDEVLTLVKFYNSRKK